MSHIKKIAFRSFLFSFFIMLLIEPSLSSEQNNRRLAIGIPAGQQNLGDSISIKYWQKKIGIQIIISWEKEKKETLFFIDKVTNQEEELKILYPLKSETNLIVYTGAGFGWGKRKEISKDKTEGTESKSTTDLEKYSIIGGVEYFLPKIENISIGFELGYYNLKEKSANRAYKQNKIFTHLFGVNYYFK